MELAGTVTFLCLFVCKRIFSCLEKWSQNKTWCFPKQETGDPSPFLPRLDHAQYLMDGMDFPPLEKVQCFLPLEELQFFILPLNLVNGHKNRHFGIFNFCIELSILLQLRAGVGTWWCQWLMRTVASLLISSGWCQLSFLDKLILNTCQVYYS